ncbi:MAG: VWA domain-containing protein [Pseudomonadota bacterium]
MKKRLKAASCGLAAMAMTVMAIGATASAQEAVTNNDTQSVIMVLDGSGSMWGQVDGAPKIEIARGVIGDLLKDWDPSIHLGLVAYGHREKGACGDIETLADVGPVDADALMTKVNAINPVGKTPISASVRQAAEALKYTEEKATVILISDGLETCDADPCALATELESKGIDFTAHVVGFDLTEEDQARLSCLAENTGGQFISANSANDLTTAMTQTVATVKEASAPQPAPVAAPPEEPASSEAQGVRLNAKLCETCEVKTDDLYWRVLGAEQDIEGKREKIEATGKPSPFFELNPGDYVASVKFGIIEKETPFSVAADRTTDVVVNLDTGALQVDAIPAEGGEVLDDKMYYRVFSAEKNLEGDRKRVAASGKPNALFYVPAGDYVVRAQHGKAEVDAPVSVTAGELTEHRFTMDVGYLRLSAAMSETSDPLQDDLYYKVLEAKQNLEGERKDIDASGKANPLFRLRAGSYVIMTRHGKAVTETPVEVIAGELVEAKITQNSGRIKWSAQMESDGAAIGKGLYWRVFVDEETLDGSRKQIDASGAAAPIFTLLQGAYVVSAKFNDVTVEKKFNVAPGDEKAMDIVFKN